MTIKLTPKRAALLRQFENHIFENSYNCLNPVIIGDKEMFFLKARKDRERWSIAMFDEELKNVINFDIGKHSYTEKVLFYACDDMVMSFQEAQKAIQSFKFKWN